ncbi:unnamed protein product [Rodentolepis nana]|uniref:Cell division protein ZapA n=1 Tax=Rodentolepis nana TaxID=102285 RepID=A0A158QGW9_RODNA|nr:unnamed protein product [Rodentolepis nana]
MMAFKSIDEKTQEFLYEEFPVRITKTGDDLYASFVRETQSSPLELVALRNDIKMALIQRAAKDSPICSIREEILYGLCSELLRQVKSLEEDIDILKQKVKALQESAEKMKKKFQEEKIAAENKRQNELRYENQLTEQLKVR